jgi:6,7-dimethyl-8-ribityllumazine synthase
LGPLHWVWLKSIQLSSSRQQSAALVGMIAGIPTLRSSPDKTMPHIALVASSWHQDIVAKATQAIHEEFARADSSALRITQFNVSGAFEIPLHAQRLARSGNYDAIIACGLIVNGGIYRHDFVCAAVIDGLMRVQLDNDVPVFSAVLTPRDFHDHEEHQKFFSEHFVKKGKEVARACLDTLNSLKSL